MAAKILVVALVLATAHGQPSSGGGSQPKRTPPPLRESKTAVKGDRPPPPVDRQGSAGEKKFIMQSNNFNVEVNAATPVPFFRFWSDAANMQVVKLDRIFQTSSPDDLASTKPLKRVNLPGAYDWTFSDAATSTDSTTNTTDVSFTVTGAAKQPGTADRPFPSLKFICHLLSNANGTEMKFDVTVSGWDETWWATDAKALVIGYKVHTVDSNSQPKANLTMSDVRMEKGAKRPNRPSKSGDSSAQKEKIAMDFGNGNGFEVVATATEATTNAAKWVKMTAINTPDGGSYVLTMYEKFKGGFTHDPNLYTASTSGTVSAAAVTLDGVPVVSLGADTGVTPGPTTTPAPTLSAAASLRASWACAAALLAVAVASAGIA